MKPTLAGVVTCVVVFGLAVGGLGTHPLLAAAAGVMVAVAVALTVLGSRLPQSVPQAIDWYWFGAFGLAWLLGTLGLTAIDGLTGRDRLQAEVVLLAAAVMAYAIGFLAGLRRARPAPLPPSPVEPEVEAPPG